MTDFGRIDFGDSDAESEAKRRSALLTEGYFPVIPVERLAHGPRWLVLGRKGSGKSALAKNLALRESEGGHFVRHVFLESFPLREMSDLADGGDLNWWQPLVWRWLLLLQVFASFRRDESADSWVDRRYFDTFALLEQHGLVATDRLGESLASREQTRGVVAEISGVGISATSTSAYSGIASLPSAVETLERLALEFTTDCRHVVIVDGLDDLLINREGQWWALSNLMTAASRLNNTIGRQGAAKVVVLCRPDVFVRLPGNDTNKIRQDAALRLNWFQESAEDEDSNLVKLASRKARVSVPGVPNIFTSVLPREIEIGSGSRRVLLRHLLERTRHTPRDFLRVLHYISERSDIEGVLDNSTIRGGIRSYADEYFVGEMRDELKGKFGPAHIDAVFDLLSSLGRNKFSWGELRNKNARRGRLTSDVLESLVMELFSVGGLGALITKHGDSTKGYVHFSFRNPSALNLEHDLQLHAALTDAWNIRWTRQGIL